MLRNSDILTDIRPAMLRNKIADVEGLVPPEELPPPPISDCVSDGNEKSPEAKRIDYTREARDYTRLLLGQLLRMIEKLVPQSDRPGFEILGEVLRGRSYAAIARESDMTKADVEQYCYTAISALEDLANHLEKDFSLAREVQENAREQYEALQHTLDERRQELADERRAHRKTAINYDEALFDEDKLTSQIRSTPIHHLPLSNHLKSALAYAGYYTLGELVSQSFDEIFQQASLSPALRKELKEFIQTKCQSLRRI